MGMNTTIMRGKHSMLISKALGFWVLWLSGKSRLAAVEASSLLGPDGSCAVVNMFPYSIGHGRWPATAHNKLAFSWAAAAQLAMDHWNDRDSSVVPELAHETTKNCQFHFSTPIFLDSAMEANTASQALWRASSSSDQCHLNENDDNESNSSSRTVYSNSALSATHGRPCGILGPMEPKTCESVAALTQALDTVQIWYWAELTRWWNDGGKEGNVVGTVLSPNSRAHVMASFFSSREIEQVAILHFGKDGSSDLAAELADVGTQYGVFVHTYERSAGRKNTAEVLETVHQSGLSTIMLNFDNPRGMRTLANVLEGKNMLDRSKYLYILSPDMTPTDYRFGDTYNNNEDYNQNTNITKLMNGALIFDILDPFRYENDDAFRRVWESQNESLVERINAAHPLRPDHEAYYQASGDFFQTEKPASLSSFIYDSVMMLGMSYCELEQQLNQANVTTIDNGSEVMEKLTELSFQGASGPITPFPKGRGYRNPDDIQVGLYQIRTASQSAEDGGNRILEPVLKTIWTKGEWKAVTGETIFFDSNGQTSPLPALLAEFVDNNYLSRGIRIIGFVIMSLTWFIALVSMISIIKLKRKSSTIIKSQPFFLILICIGSIITSFAIFTLSWDEHYGASDHLLDVACMASQWSFFIGHVMTYMALFSKLWRVDKVIQFRRNNVVTIRHVLGPLIAILVVTFGILILWTAIDPWTWERNWKSVIPPAESYGECTNDQFWPYFGPLMAVVLLAESLTTFFAFRTASAPEDLTDSRYVILAIYTHVQSWVVGVPILSVLGHSSADATYITRVLVIWIFSISSVLLVVGPKIYVAVMVEPHQKNVIGSTVRVSGISLRGNESLPGLSIGSGKSSYLCRTGDNLLISTSTTHRHSKSYDETVSHNQSTDEIIEDAETKKSSIDSTKPEQGTLLERAGVVAPSHQSSAQEEGPTDEKTDDNSDNLEDIERLATKSRWVSVSKDA